MSAESLQLVLFWHRPRRCSCAGTLPTTTPDTPSRPIPMIVVDRTPGRYVQLCVTHGTPLSEVRESRQAPHGLWCNKGQHAPVEDFVLYDRTCKRAVKVSLRDPETEDDDEGLIGPV